MLPQLTLVLGGAASGKSAFAERLCCSAGQRRIYIATAEARDPEMSVKIETHQVRRGADWACVEAPLELVDALTKVNAGHVVLVDCATMWLANQMAKSDIVTDEEAELLSALNTCASPVIMVSNELGQGIVPENALARRFRQAHGEMNQKLAAQAALVVNVIAGLPLALKGTLPEGAL